MTNLSLIQESIVDESEIDSLGHMNVRFYVSRAANANFKLLADLGVQAKEGEALRRLDTYNRFHKEQFAGAKLGVYGGLIPVESDVGVTGYYEIRNLDSDDIAASFIITTNLVNTSNDQVLPIARLEEPTIAPYRTEVPVHGQPRSLNLTPPRMVSMEEISTLIPYESKPHSINGRREAIVLDEDCDAEGRLKESVDPMFVMFRPQPGEDLKEIGPPVQRDELGRRYSFAMMEIRSINFHRPTLGDTILSMSADVAYGEKWRHTRRWIFAKESGVLLGISDHAAVCMDLDARRAIPIPAEVRLDMEQNSLQDYR
jgi:acyl-CoA thioester hydrolase